MATLTSQHAGQFMRLMNLQYNTQHWTKAQITAALQAIEDRMQLASTKNAIASDIEAAAPGVFNADQKTKLYAIWSTTFAEREGII